MKLIIMTPLEKFLNNLQKVRKTKPGCYSALCPAHDDKRPSLSIRERDDGVLLLKCWHGCSAPEIVSAAGLQMQDLYPDQHDHHSKGDRRPFPAAEALRMVAFEALVVAAAATAIAAGEPLSAVDRERLLVATGRLRGAASGAGL